MVQIYIAGSKLSSTKKNMACVCIDISLLASCSNRRKLLHKKGSHGFCNHES